MATNLNVLAIAPSAEATEQLDVALRQAGFTPDVAWTDNPDGALAQLKVQRFDLVVAEPSTPQFSALSALETVQSSPQGDLPLVVIASEIDLSEAVELMHRGAYDVVSDQEWLRLGPVVRRALVESEERRLRQYDREALRDSNARLREALAGTVHAIAKAVEARDPYTAGHQRRVAQLAEAIALGLGFDNDRVEGVRLGAAIHDIGKLTIPAELLTKPSSLSPVEYEVIKTHTGVGHEILGGIHFPWPVHEMVYQHHERLDGSGYPQGLRGDQIALEARIVGVADVVEAMLSYRPYRPAKTLEEAMGEIRAGRGVKYDAEVVEVCLKLFETGGFVFESQF